MAGCSVDGCGESVFSRGLCQKHYTRMRRTGQLERKNVVLGDWCIVPGCGRTAHAKNLCSTHYQRDRPALNQAWRALRSRAGHGQYPPEWDDYDFFCAVVGDRPGEKHQLRRPDPLIPWSADNFTWLAPIDADFSWDTKEYMRVWHQMKHFGLTDADIQEMLDEQNYACPVCTRHLHEADDKGKPQRICIDHDHQTGVARGLIHDNCNKGMGLLRDDAANLRRAAEFVEFYSKEENQHGPHKRFRKTPKAH